MASPRWDVRRCRAPTASRPSTRCELPADRELSRATLLRAAVSDGRARPRHRHGEPGRRNADRLGPCRPGRGGSRQSRDPRAGPARRRRRHRGSRGRRHCGGAAAARRSSATTRRHRSRCSRRSSRDSSPKPPPRSCDSSSRPSRPHPQYARAHLAIWEVCTDEEQHARALAAAQAVPASSRFSRRARFAAGLSLIHLKRWDEAFTAYKTLLDESPTAAVYNNLGVIQARRGSITAADRQARLVLLARLGGGPRFARLLLQPRLRLLARQGHAGRHLLAPRGRASSSGRRRGAFRAGRGAAGDQQHGRGDAGA